jgi:probable metal-binding protein
MSVHGTEILNMVKGQGFLTKDEILKQVENKFGKDVRFHACAFENYSASEVLEFFVSNGKFERDEKGHYRFFCGSDC